MKILDACCGSKMFWFDKENESVDFMDKRNFETQLCDGRDLIVNPDIVGDFRCMEFEDEVYDMVVFDPPHLLQSGDKSWLAQKYGKLDKDTWQEDIKLGFSECFRVLKKGGTLIFKWNTQQVKLSSVLKLTDKRPLFGNKRPKQSKTHWLVFIKN